MSKKDGGPAYPILERTEHIDGSIVCVEWSGMRVRQFYKAAALQGLLAGSLSTEELYDPVAKADSDIKTAKRMIADCAGEIASEMIREDEDHESNTQGS